MKAYQSIKEDNYREIAKLEAEQRAAAKRFSKNNFEDPLYKQIFSFRGNSEMSALGNFAGRSHEIRAREEQNKEIDAFIKSDLESQSKRDKAQKVIEVKNKEYWENQKKSAQDAYEALDEIGRKSKQGQALAKKISEADGKIADYNVTSRNKSAAKAALADERKNLTEEKQLKEQREQLQKQTNDKLEALRIDRLDGIEKDRAINQRDYNQMVEDYKKLGFYNETTKGVLNNWLTGANANSQAKYDEQSKRESDQALKQKTDAQKQAYEELMKEAGTYQYRLSVMEKERDDRIAALERDRANITEDEYKRRLSIIKGAFQVGANELKIFEQSIFKKLGNNIETSSKEAIDGIIHELDEIIKTGKFSDGLDVPPNVLLNLKNTQEQLQGIRGDITELEVSSSKLGRVAGAMMSLGKNMQSIGSAIAGVDGGGDSEMIARMGTLVYNLGENYIKISKAVKLAKAVADNGSDVFKNLLESNDLWGAILAIINIIVDMLMSAKKAKEQLAQAQRDLADSNAEAYLGEFKITEELREQKRLKAESIDITRKEIAERRRVALESKKQINEETAAIYEKIKAEGEYIAGRYIGRKNSVVTEYGSLKFYNQADVLKELQSLGFDTDIMEDVFKNFGREGKVSAGLLRDLNNEKVFGDKGSKSYKTVETALNRLEKSGAGLSVTFKDLQALDSEGFLDGATKRLYDQLVELEKQGADVENVLTELADYEKEIDTGTTAKAISDSIIDGFRSGKSSAADFAQDFESMMRTAMLNGLRYDPEFEQRTKEWYDKFAQYAADGVIDATEKGILQSNYGQIIEDQDRKRKLLELASGVSLSDVNNSGGGSTLSKAISGASQESITLLAGHTQGMRIAQLKTNEILLTGFADWRTYQNIARSHLSGIERNTFNTVAELKLAVGELKTLNGKVSNGADAALAMGGTG